MGVGVNNEDARFSIDLGGDWLYRLDPDVKGEQERYFDIDCDRSTWRIMAVPNNWYLTELGDYDGVVWFHHTFQLEEGFAGRSVSLRFRAVDYIAKVWLNGIYLGSHEGYFNPFEFDVTETLHPGKNCLVVEVDSPRDPTQYVLVDDPNNLSTPLSTPYKRHWAKDLSIVKGHLIDAMHRPGAMTSFRQDGNTGGIWQTVELIARGPVQISYTKIYCKIVERDFVSDGTALVMVDLELENTKGRVTTVKAVMSVAAENFQWDRVIERERVVELQPGSNIVKLVVTVPDARLWWTWDHGEPSLYRAEFRVERDGGIDDSTGEIFGIKEVRHDEASGHWYLNGRKIFLRGMRYYSSMYMSEITEERIKRDLDDMLAMNINSIRIGSHVELDVFYRLCDRMGFLVWQNFPLHYCYSDSDELIERAAPMMRDMVRMLHNHASIGMWSVFKEPQIYGLPNMPNNYGRLCEALYESGKTVDPLRWMHKGDYQEGVQNLMTGCCQPGDLDMKRIRIEPNIVEFGSHALPPLESLKEIIPEKDLWPPNWDIWEYWGFFYDLQVRFTKLDLSVASLEELIEQSQAIEAKTIKEQIEFLRQRKYAPVGSMYLYYWSDPAPVIGSGIVDYFGRKLPAYHSMQKVYTPVLVSLEWNKDPYIIGYRKFWKPGDLFIGKVWVNNDFHRIVAATLSWQLSRKGGTSAILKREMALTLPEDSATVVDTVLWSIPRDSSGEHIVTMRVTGADGGVLSENDFDFEVG
jgi:beta-mannosidase